MIESSRLYHSLFLQHGQGGDAGDDIPATKGSSHQITQPRPLHENGLEVSSVKADDRELAKIQSLVKLDSLAPLTLLLEQGQDTSPDKVPESFTSEGRGLSPASMKSFYL